MSEAYRNAKEYLKVHWMAILLGAVPTLIVAIITLINIFVAFRVDYLQLKLTVQANNDQLNLLTKELRVVQDSQNQSIARILQSEMDNQNQLNSINAQVNTIYSILTKK